MLVRCQDETIDPMVEGIAIEDTDLIQVDDANPLVPVSFTAESSNLGSITISIVPKGATTPVYTNTLDHITTDKLNRVKLNVPFPTPDVAPSGEYTITIGIDGKDATSSFTVNVLNNRTIKYCDFPSVPAGKVAIFVTIPGGEEVTATGKDVYIVGNFMAKNGADGDWNAGNPDFKLTKLGDQCYYIFLDKFDNGDKYKFTLGDWDHEFLGPKGEGLGDQTAPGGNVNYTIYNFKTLPVTQYIVPEVLPYAAIQTGNKTILVDVGKAEDNIKYYLIEKGATSLDGATEMFRVAGTNKLAAAVPKESDNGKEFQIAKTDITNLAAVSANPFGFDPVVYSFEMPTEFANPTTIGTSAIGFSKDLQKTYETFLLVGGASEAGWDNSSNNDQLFTKVSDSKFEIILPLYANSGYLIIPEIGNWDIKIGKDSGDPLAGTVRFGGGDLVSPETAGTYKIELDLVTATYKLTLQ